MFIRRRKPRRTGVRKLPDLATLPLKMKMVDPLGRLTPDQCRERVRAALHEAAHFVAACAFRSYVIRVEVYTQPPTPQRRASRNAYRMVGDGYTESDDTPEQVPYTTFAGYAWEGLYGDTSTAEHDLEQVISELVAQPHVVSQTIAFVKKHERLIRLVAKGILLYCKADGTLSTGGRFALQAWCESQILGSPNFYSRAGCPKPPVFTIREFIAAQLRAAQPNKVASYAARC